MKVLVAGATGALGRQLVPRLIAAGHEVSALTRSAAKRQLLESMGARPLLADALDPDEVAAAVASSDPEAIVHELTALSGSVDMRHFDRDFELTNRLRTEATEHLLSAGRAVGVRRFVAQSYAGWPYERRGGPVKSARAGVTVRIREVNGCPGALLVSAEGAVVGAMALEVDAGRVFGVNSVVNPEKLRHLAWLAAR